MVFFESVERRKLLTNIAKSGKGGIRRIHRRTGLEILGGRTRICPTRAFGGSLGGSGGMLRRKILKNRVSLMPFPAFWCGFLCMEQVTNEKKILRILVKQNMNRKIARLLSKNCPTN